MRGRHVKRAETDGSEIRREKYKVLVLKQRQRGLVKSLLKPVTHACHAPSRKEPEASGVTVQGSVSSWRGTEQWTLGCKQKEVQRSLQDHKALRSQPLPAGKRGAR